MIHDHVQLLGISDLDEDHLTLGYLIAELELSGENNAPAAEVGSIAARLVEAARAHFGREEEIMARDDYPFLKRHREAHEQLIKDIEVLAAQFAAGDLKPDKDAIAALWGWEITHIDDADRAYAAYALNKSCNAPPGTPA